MITLEANVFQADGFVMANFPEHGFLDGKWYWAEVTWTTFHGPYDSRLEADVPFQLYVREVKMCPGCED